LTDHTTFKNLTSSLKGYQINQTSSQPKMIQKMFSINCCCSCTWNIENNRRVNN